MPQVSRLLNNPSRSFVTGKARGRVSGDAGVSIASKARVKSRSSPKRFFGLTQKAVRFRGKVLKTVRVLAGLLLLTGGGSATALTLYGDKQKYPANFSHFEYADPANAKKGGAMRLHFIGTFDSFNPYILKGVPATGITSYVDATLMKASLDEPLSHYGYIASHAQITDRSAIFTIRDEARFSDGVKITAGDAVFSFNTLRQKGHPLYRLYFADIESAQVLSPQRVEFIFTENARKTAPFVIGTGLPILPSHQWQNRNFATPTLEKPVGAGPYTIGKFSAGRAISYQRVKNWWGENLAINRGFYNFNQISYLYFRDETVALTAFKANDYDFRLENQAKAWAKEYNFGDRKDITVEEISHLMPSGMQGFVLNTRKQIFKDKRVRKAIVWAYDFEWANRVLFHNQYTRSKSYFANSPLASTGLPSKAELALLAPHRGKIPPEAFSQEFTLPTAGTSIALRKNLRRARELLAEAGWQTQQGKLINSQTGEPFRFEILLRNPHFERVAFPFIANLEKLGMEVSLRMLQEDAGYQKRLEEFDFDMAVTVFPASLSPANELFDMYSSDAAQTEGSRNLAGIQSEAVDELLERIAAARTRSELTAAVGALDRVLAFGYYVVPHWHLGRFRIAFWNKFNRPATLPLYGLTIDTWWIDPTRSIAASTANSKDTPYYLLGLLALGWLFYRHRRRKRR